MNKLGFLLLVLGLAACGGGEVAAEPAGTTQATHGPVTTTTEPPTTITPTVPATTTTVEVIAVSEDRVDPLGSPKMAKRIATSGTPRPSSVV